MKQFAAYAMAIAMVTVGCSSSDSSSSTTARPATASSPVRDACSLITTDEAAKILGSPATATKRSAGSDRSTCDYVTQSFESFTLEVVWSGAEDAIKSARSAATTAAAAAGGKQDQVVNDVMGLQRIPDLGDEAYFSRRTMSYVRKGDVLLTFQNAGLNDPALEHWRALAQAALAKL